MVFSLSRRPSHSYNVRTYQPGLKSPAQFM